MDVMTYLLAAPETRIVAFLAGWVAGIVSFALLAKVAVR